MSSRVSRSKSFVGRFRDTGGAVSVMAAFFLVFILAFSAVAVDAGSLLLARRTLQAATDAAALAAASNLPSAAAVAGTVLQDNGYDASGLAVVTGVYTADENLPKAARFVAAASGQNAVQVTKTFDAPLFFARAVGFAPTTRIMVQAIATRVPALSFAAGTRLAELDSGLANSLLGAMLGTSLTLSVADYRALASANIDALSFLDALAVRAHSTAVTYGDLGDISVTPLDIILAASDVAQNGVAEGDGPAASAALSAFASRVPAGTSHSLRQILDLSLWASRRIGDVSAASAAGFNLNILALISSAARVAAANTLISQSIALSVPITGTGITMKMAVGAPMAQVNAGHVGSSVHTAQIRLLLVANILNPIAGIASVRLPVYIESAAGTATASAIPCDRSGTMAQLTASSALVTATFGDATDAALANFAAPLVPSTATLVQVNILGIKINLNVAGSVGPLSGGPATLDFSQADIDGVMVRSVSATGSNTMFANLATALTINTEFLSAPGLLAAAVNATLGGILGLLKPALTPVVSALATPVSQVLTALGLQLGVIDTIVTGVSCHAPVLVD